MSNPTIYILALLGGAVLGAISLMNKKNKEGEQTDQKDSIPPKDVINPILLKAILDHAEVEMTEEEYIQNRITVVGNDIFINNDNPKLRYRDIEIQPILKFEKEIPVINIFEDGGVIRSFVLEPKNENPNLKDQHFHMSIRVNANSSVQIDGFISKSQSPEQTEEGIRFQPFFLSDRQERNKDLAGKGMFQRGLHYSGYISSKMRLICICDECLKSFTVEFYHAGFSEVQYFYSSNSKETLLVPYDGKVPTQLQKEINPEELKTVESSLPQSNDGTFEYYNGFKCPHCYADYINFRENMEIRPNEYYVNFYINQKPIQA